jgi:hypothetical protein
MPPHEDAQVWIAIAVFVAEKKQLSSEATRSAARVVGEEHEFTGEGFSCWASVPF